MTDLSLQCHEDISRFFTFTLGIVILMLCEQQKPLGTSPGPSGPEKTNRTSVTDPGQNTQPTVDTGRASHLQSWNTGSRGRSGGRESAGSSWFWTDVLLSGWRSGSLCRTDPICSVYIQLTSLLRFIHE
ncbi:hypothetical protein AMECASPLE_039841 [Ameca splendens]|uniref:Uncharacterized protein n=1 Tax=Ameca splendens TaxID=208324 RepID=A0ABV0Z7D5_9TELE